MNRKIIFGLVFIAAVFCISNSFAQSKKLTLEDIYTNNVYRAKGFGQIRWMKDNKGYSTLENNTASKGNDIVAYDAESGARKVLVNANIFNIGVMITANYWFLPIPVKCGAKTQEAIIGY